MYMELEVQCKFIMIQTNADFVFQKLIVFFYFLLNLNCENQAKQNVLEFIYVQVVLCTICILSNTIFFVPWVAL